MTDNHDKAGLPTDDFEKRFQLLELLSECAESMALFNAKYEILLDDIQSLSGPRLKLAPRLKAPQIKQESYLRTLAAEAQAEENVW